MTTNNYLIYGNDYDLINARINEILVSERFSIDEIKIDLQTESFVKVFEELDTIPFLTEKKAIVVKGFDLLFSKSATHDNHLKKLFEYLIRPLSTNYLFLIIPNKNLIAPEVIKDFTKHCQILDLLEDSTDLFDYTKKSFAADGYYINDDLVKEIVTQCDDILALKNEIEKLKSYANSNKKINYDDVKLIISKKLETKIYELINSVLEKNIKRTYAIYEELTIVSAQENIILSQLISKFQELYEIKQLVKGGYGKEDIINLYNVTPGRAYYMQKNAQAVSEREIKDNLDELSKLEYMIKSGRVNQEMGLQLYLLK